MFITPASFAGFGRRLTHDAAEGLARNWTTLLLNGIVLVIAGVLIFSIDWSVRSLSTFLGALFILEGVWAILTVGKAFADHSANGAAVGSGSERHARASAASSS